MTENELIREAQVSISETNWTLGRVATEWLQQFARGRDLKELAEILKTSHPWLVAYQKIWDRCGAIRHQWPHLRWVHFFVVVYLPDWSETLDWANTNLATVDEMLAWHRMQHGTPLDSEPADETDSPAEA